MLSVRSDPSPPAVLAAQAVEELRLLPTVVGLCLLGSVARGDERPDSDVDVLVATREPLAPRTMLTALPARLRARPLSLVSKTPEELHKLAAEGSLFLAHARTEGRVVYDPERVFANVFELSTTVPLDTEAEIRRRVSSLKHYRDLERFGDNFLFALAHLYGIGKGIAIARSAEAGNTTFVKSDALARLAQVRPDLRPDIEAIQRLRPFYDLTRGHQVAELPFHYVGADEETRRAVEAVAHLAELDGVIPRA
jgi:predicted nucleotidyltransferase